MPIKQSIFQHTTTPTHPLWWRVFFWAWNLTLVVLSSLALGVLSLYLAPATSHAEIFHSYFDNTTILAFNLIPVLILTLIVYFCTGRATFAYWTTAVVVGLFSVINYFKLLFRNDPFIFEDFLLWKEAGKMMESYALYFTDPLAKCLFATVVMGLIIQVFARGRMKGISYYRIGGVLISLIALSPLSSVMWNDVTYVIETANNTFINQWASTQVYYSKGFVYPFIYSAKSALSAPPDGYNEKETAALLDSYSKADIAPDKQASVFTIMLEAYTDFTPYGIDGLSDDVYADYHALQDESYTGTLVTNIFSGGTVDSERCYLTGYAHLPNFRSNTNSYPWYFREQGYSVLGAHPCFDWFYNRVNVMEYLGFEDYWFVENYYTPMTNGVAGYDDVFFPSLIELWERNQTTGQPLFAYNLNYQGHGPYDSNSSSWGDDHVISDKYQPSSINIMNNYFGMIQDTNARLVEFFDYFRSSEEPVIIVLFGDHKPWFGDGNSVYKDLGMTFDMSTKEGFYEYYSTNYLIWANQAAKDNLGCDFTGKGPDISANFLMNLVFQQAGWTGPSYLQATNDVMAQVPVINVPTGYYLENDAITTTLSPEGQSLIRNFNMMEYYQKKHFAYGDIS